MFVRTVTTFAVLTTQREEWEASIHRATNHNQQCKELLEKNGYTVQTTRIITNPYPEYVNISSKEAFLNDIKYLTSFVSEGTRFNIGACTSPKFIETLQYLPEAIKLYNVSASALITENEDGIVDLKMCQATAETIRTIADITPGGEGNFNFCGSGSPLRTKTVESNQSTSTATDDSKRNSKGVVNPPSSRASWDPEGGSMVGVPYFPGGYTTTNEGWYCTIGLQFPDILVNVLQSLGKNSTSSTTTANSSIVPAFDSRADAWSQTSKLIRWNLSQSMSEIATLVNEICEKTNIPIKGIDGSIAPAPSAASVVDIYKLLGLLSYGAPGTLEISAFLTRTLKSVPVYILNQRIPNQEEYIQYVIKYSNELRSIPLIGYTGLMLPPTEDIGLAEAHTNNQYTIRDLLMYSAVCGIGLDTVPVPGDTSVEKITTLLADVITLSYRLGKPLSVRLFPVPGLFAGDMTKFDNPNLCNTKVFHV